MTDTQPTAGQEPQRADKHDTPLLEVTGLEKRFGGIKALDGIDVEIPAGQITGLIGPNGAGKTTLFNCITGLLTPDSGRVIFDNRDITADTPATVAQSGLVRTFQIPRELSEMTVYENLLLAPPDQHGEHLIRTWLRGDQFFEDETKARAAAADMAEFLEIDHLLHEPAGNLSGGQRKLLELGRVLLTDPELVLLDEPVAGVNPTLERKILDRLHELVESGYSLLIVEHDMDVIMNHCDRVIVMHQGQKLTEGPPDAVSKDETVIQAYLGEDL